MILKNNMARIIIFLCTALVLTPQLLAQDHEEEEAQTGAHGGRLLEDGDFAIELAIFEQGVPPEYRAWAVSGESELSPDDWQLTVELTRLGGQLDRFSFSSSDDYKLGAGVVEEPHSFEVSVTASYQGSRHTWQFDSHEGRMEMSPAMAESMNIGVHVATAQSIRQTKLMYGKISPDPKLVSHITARYPGLIQSVSPGLGDSVSQGQLIATVEANDSLQTYEIRSPISGIVVDSHANPGEYAGDQHLLTIANYPECLG
jgi:membrane fusion protein, heavy metal efflux system